MSSGAVAGAPIQSALHAEGLSFGYAGAPVFEGVTLRVQPGEIVSVLGASGCGKSTLLRVLAGLAAPTSGTVFLSGVPLSAPHPRAALVFQQPSLLPWLDVAGNVGFGLDFARQPARTDKRARAERVARAIAAVGLAGNERTYPAQLSGGMAQRVALGRALAREPILLFADEPFSALDAIARVEMQTLMVELLQRWASAAVLVTHDLDEAIHVADRVLLLGRPAPGQAARILREWMVEAGSPRNGSPGIGSPGIGSPGIGSPGIGSPGSGRPRDAALPALVELRRDILEVLRAHRSVGRVERASTAPRITSQQPQRTS